MANTKTKDVENAEEVINPWKEMVTITIPKRYKKDKRRHVKINGRIFNCKVDVPIEVPKPVALVIEQSIKQRAAYEALIEKYEAEAVKSQNQ